MLIRECTADDLEPLEEISPSPVNREHARRLARQLAGAETYLLAWHEEVLAGHGAVQWQGCTDAEVRSVDVDNPDAGRLYERLGYLAKMRYRGVWSYLDAAGTKHIVDEPAIFMVKDLQR
ncbi:GNAT family N-acetyltransferase [Actinopolymorpha pittospori]